MFKLIDKIIGVIVLIAGIFTFIVIVLDSKLLS